MGNAPIAHICATAMLQRAECNMALAVLVAKSNYNILLLLLRLSAIIKMENEENNVRYDLGTFVVSVTRLKTQGKPLVVLFNAASSLIRYAIPLWDVFILCRSAFLLQF